MVYDILRIYDIYAVNSTPSWNALVSFLFGYSWELLGECLRMLFTDDILINFIYLLYIIYYIINKNTLKSLEFNSKSTKTWFRMLFWGYFWGFYPSKCPGNSFSD